ncbi:MAG TPA: CocE/NonD family hydrolase [Steroidobacteraceae bacterium]|nr:CocE/NonD family hydrolase [Steroidobacteraceae bacterium]
MQLTRRDFVLGGCVAAMTAGAGAQDNHKATARSWQFPAKEPFRTIENSWIPLKDGTQLGVRLWIPLSADHTPVPVVFEYIPYRKRDLERGRDDEWASAFVPYGFAFARVDIRGSGDSQGLLVDEYLQREQDDAVEIIAWLASQPWSNGAVGMRGISWGGFACFQAAAMQPPALKAIIPQCATDNRYTDDAHYVGGALTLDMYDWGAEFKNVMVGPPDPAISGERWREMWLARLEHTPPILATWLSHQRYDGYWQHGSIATHYAAVKCPAYVVGGQIDSYRDFLPRTLRHLSVPRKGLMGPWGHKYPQIADPGPGLDWVTEEVRWWTQWLRGVDTGIMKEPMLRAFMEEKTAAEVWPDDVPGRWIAEPSWPSSRVSPQVMFLDTSGLQASAGAQARLRVKSQETLGLTKREWFPWNMSIDLPPDQMPDDLRSLVFDSEPLSEDLEILGNPLVKLRLSASEPVAKVAVRLNEVTPDGRSWSVSYGILNLTHRDSHTDPTPLVVGRDYDVEVSCYFTAHRFKRGNRVRIALSESLWPMIWPSPKPVELSILTGVSSLTLPARPRGIVDPPMPIQEIKGRVAAEERADTLSSSRYEVRQSGPDAHGRVIIHKRLRELPEMLTDIGTTISGGSDWFMSIQEGDPNSSVWQLRWFSKLTRGDWDTMTESSMELSSTAEEFRIKESITAWEASKPVFERSWDNRIKRDLI